jgi:exodeoxyribonuclease V alpha subunit
MTTAAIDREFTWDATQLAAIDRCCDMQQRIVPVTGVAGTGKTTIIREVYKALTAAGYSVALCAPTGKAAKRIQEATGLPAMTIHRLLEYPHPGERDPKTGAAMISTVPKRDKENPIREQVVLADEYAMVNREVHRNLIDALPPGGRLCMFGDVNQLKPIEQGKGALAESPFEAGLRKFDGIVLATIHRQLEGSGVAFNGERILAGRVPMRKDDFVMRITEQPIDSLMTYVMEMLDKGINYGTNQGQIISPTKRSWVGTHKLNVALQDMLNPIGMSARMKIKRHTWDEKNPVYVGVGDKVIWTQNTYDLRNEWERYYDGDPANGYIPTPAEKVIMNGESGVITAIDDDGNIHIDVGDRVVEVPKEMTVQDRRNNLVTIDPRRDMDLGFVITTHKAQGSEWPHIIYMLNRSTMFIQSRHNFYTAISRARLTCTVITDQPSLQNSVFQKMSAAERSGK